VPIDHDEQKVLKYYERFYRIARQYSGLQFDPATVAKLELEYNDVHRRLAMEKNPNKTEFVETMVQLHSAIFDISPEQARPSAVLRVEANNTVDKITGKTSSDIEGDWAKLENYLRLCYRSIQKELKPASSKAKEKAMSKKYSFVTIWKVNAPVEKVWDAITDSLKWPQWWKGVEKVVELEKGDADGIGSVHRYTWKSALPYRLSFDMRLTKMEKYKYLEGEAFGELVGKGIWHFNQTGNITTIRYNWDVSTTKVWMNFLAPLLKPAFEWNHDYVMKSGGEGLAKLLDTKLVSTEEENAKKDPTLPVLAGVAGLAASAGVVVFLARRKKPAK
jgi:hypothetical protein